MTKISAISPLSSESSPLSPLAAPAPAHKPAPVKEAEPAPQATAPVTDSASNVSIHFRIQAETNEVTVFVVDRQTHQVLRSIPASELHKLKAGELLKIAA
jgi:hypothetical protein